MLLMPPLGQKTVVTDVSFSKSIIATSSLWLRLLKRKRELYIFCIQRDDVIVNFRTFFCLLFCSAWVEKLIEAKQMVCFPKRCFVFV